jgi:catechol 2,3-dioxygenase-like lactoylglutathione lyase family enzyme
MNSFFLSALLGSVALAATVEPPLRVSMIAVGVTNMERSVAFYCKTLGLRLIGKPGEVTLLDAGGVTIALNHPLARAAGSAIVGAIEIVFPVDSVSAVHTKLVGRGCNFVAGPREVTAGTWAATFTDPDGHKLTLLGPR